MLNKQQQKTIIAKTVLKKAAKEKFLEKGYEETSIIEIANLAEYSVGSFYRHWSGKAELFMEIWDDHVSEFISGSVSNAPKSMERDEMIKHLLKRSEEYANNPVTKKLSLTSYALSATYKYKSALIGFNDYKMMLFLFLKNVSNSKNESRIMSVANILHCILNADALRETPIEFPKYQFERNVLYDCINALIDMCDDNYNA